MSKGPLNYTTQVDPAKTAGECIGMLARHGANRVGLDYDAERLPVGISFEIMTPYGVRGYSLPVNVAGTQKKLDQAYASRRIERRFTGHEQARRVAWRVVKDMLEAQLALAEAGLADLAEVMLPWMMTKPELTMYGAWQQTEQRALEAGG